MKRINISIAFRYFVKNKLFTGINIVGLSIGVCTAMVIFLIVQYDFSFDKGHQDGDRIYRVVSDFKFSGEDYSNMGIPFPLASSIKQNTTGIASVAHYYSEWETKINIPVPGDEIGSMYKNEKQVVYADAGYFKLFNYKWLSGSRNEALNEPYKTVITSDKAAVFFPDIKPTDIIGKTIIINDSIRTIITGVVQPLPFNSDLLGDVFVSMKTVAVTGLKENFGLESWGNTNSASQLYVKIAEGASIKNIEAQLEKLERMHRGDNVEDAANYTTWKMQPLSDIHFNSKYGVLGDYLANKTTLYGLMIIACFILLLACINFINLATAQASRRAKEIGIRKTLGSSKKQLITQFLTETFLLTLIATILSVLLGPFLLKLFKDFISPGISFNWAEQPELIIFLLALIGIITLLSGYYPAWVLTKYNPTIVLKNVISGGSSKSRQGSIRKALTVLQFVIAQVFLIATLVVSKQIHYSIHKDLGFKKEAIISIDAPYNYFSNEKDTKRFVLAEKIKAIADVKMISISGTAPSSNNVSSGEIKYADGKKEISTDVQFKQADNNYIDIFGLQLLAGNNLPVSDTFNAMIINETYSKVLGFKTPEMAIGKNLEWSGLTLPIVGVVKDFNQQSLHTQVKPLSIVNGINNNHTIHIKFNTGVASFAPAISKIEKAYKEIYPEDEFSYQFFDESISKLYENEQHVSRLLNWAAGIAILISCLGLLGLVIYTTNQRIKEIGIRKVLGATVVQIVQLLSYDFLKLVCFAFLIAVPLAWWAANSWLENFAYRTDLSWWIFMFGGLGTLVIAILVLSIKTYQAANANPTQSLKTE